MEEQPERLPEYSVNGKNNWNPGSIMLYHSSTPVLSFLLFFPSFFLNLSRKSVSTKFTSNSQYSASRDSGLKIPKKFLKLVSGVDCMVWGQPMCLLGSVKLQLAMQPASYQRCATGQAEQSAKMNSDVSPSRAKTTAATIVSQETLTTANSKNLWKDKKND